MRNSEHAKRVGRLVRSRMVLSEVGQGDVAQALGLSQSAVSRRLTGEVPFDVTEIVTVARLLNVTPTELLDLEVAAEAVA